MLMGNRAMRRIREIGYDINEVLEEVDRLIEDMRVLSAELQYIVSLMGRV